MSTERERFAPAELALVLDRFDLGTATSAREIARGSRRSPKLLLSTTAGRFLLKRRSAAQDRGQRTEFAHALIQHLRLHRFPVAAPRPMKGSTETVLMVGGRIYEVFEFIEGDVYDGSLDQTLHAGKTLARFHRAVADMDETWPTPRLGYHDSGRVRDALHAVPSSAASHDSVVGHEAELLSLTTELHERYDEAAQRAAALGYDSWPPWIVHGDWHPGNMLFREQRVCAVLDFDSVRIQPRALDIANALLQFSIIRGGQELDDWPAFFDTTRMRRFWTGYLSKMDIPAEQRQAMVPLMIESALAEAVVPIALTGSLGQIPGFGVLQVVRRKIRWLLDHADAIKVWMME